MTARILDGKALAQAMQAELAADVARFVEQTGVRPGLATVLVGENHPGRLYVKNKVRQCGAVGITSFHEELPSSVTDREMLALVGRLNADPAVHGILVQLPLPRHLNEDALVEALDPLKDVDGFGPTSLGLLTAGRPRFLACTPYGVMQLLARHDIPTAGRDVVIVGRSNIVGKPLALLLAQKGIDATVTICHSRTRDVGAHTRQADIVVMAIGQADYLKADMVKPGAVVIDVGQNPLGNNKWTGDVDFAGVSRVASAITPVPGGVGPMTITMLLYNTLQAARLQQGRAK
ncbi:MAG: bifunctional 5,10-methylenetetrahydrofolate dehydrogenase/5,10-methenyltetrahydrofolate cyclohydrolase [Gemmataceae bacterium]